MTAPLRASALMRAVPKRAYTDITRLYKDDILSVCFVTWDRGMAPFTARNRSDGSSSLTTLDGGATKGYKRIPPVERAVAMQLCPNSTWRGELCLPSRACKYSLDLTSKAYVWGSRLCRARYGVAAGPSGQGTEGTARG